MNFNDVARSIARAIDDYQYINGKSPSKIFMTRQLVYYLMPNMAYNICRDKNGSIEFRGISVQDYIDKDCEYRYYLAGDPGDFYWLEENRRGRI